MTRDEAVAAFRDLVACYGLDWDFTVPPSAFEQLCKINDVLVDESDRRAALGLPDRGAEQRG